MRMKSRGRATEILQRRMESCKQKNFINVEELVNHLCSDYPDYRRMKVRVLTTCVRQALEHQRKQNQSASTSKAINVDDESDAEEEDDIDPSTTTTTTTPSQISTPKKLRENDDREAVNLRLKRRFQDSPTTSASSASVEATGNNLISEDAKVEPEFDGKAKKMEVGRGETRQKGELTENLKSGEKEGEKLKGSGESSAKVKGGPRFKDLGGMKGILDELNMEVIAPLYHPELPLWLGVKPMSGILLHGPPGCGKTKLAHAIANETGVPFYKISATEVVSGVSGASEENIRDLFSKAYRTAPSIVFIDEIDAIASKRENLQREMERRIVTQLLTCMDDSYHIIDPANGDLGSPARDLKPGFVLVIGATNRPNALDPALRRPGRFDREIALGVPDEKARAEILSVLACKLRLENGGAFDIGKIARTTAGFVGADLEAMVNKAGNLAMRRIFNSRKSNDGVHNEDWLTRPWLPEEMEGLSINMIDFEEAVKMVQPSSRREGFSTIPNVKWEDVGGLDFLRKEFDRYIVSRIKDPQDYEEFGVDMETGFLLYGPPGCGKTLIAKAVANEAGANFIHIKGPELMNKYVGESELAVRTIFSRARTCSPCILFFDEVDVIAMKRGKEGAWVVERLFTQLLIELDGADQRRGVFVIGATNRPQVMDEAIIRPGRLGKLLYVPLPGSDQRGSILKALARKKPISPDVDLFAVGRKEACENLSGADLAAVMNEAAMVALEEKRMSGQGSSDTKNWTIKETHLDQALDKITPSVSTKRRRFYDNLSKELRGMMRTTVEPNARVSYQDVIIPPLSG